MKSPIILLLALCAHFQTLSATTALADSLQPYRDSIISSTLNELSVSANSVIRTRNAVTLTPTKEQVHHSWTGYELLRSMMIPGVNVNITTGEINALGGQASLYIDGLPADIKEIRQLRPADVARIQYYEAPTGKYAGDHVAINFIIKKKQSGGYITADAMQRIGYANGDYNLSGKVYRDATQYTLFAGSDYQQINDATSTRSDILMFPSVAIGRNYTSNASFQKRNSQYAQFRIRNKNDRRTLRATLTFVRNATPLDSIASILNYSGMESCADLNVSSLRHSAKHGIKYGIGLSGSFNLPRNQFMELSASASANSNNYSYIYTESAQGEMHSFTSEDYYNIQGNLTYGLRFSKGNTLTFKVTEMYLISSANYSDITKQHLWSSETICFSEYMHQLWDKASIRIAPGFSYQTYRQHGYTLNSHITPRAQLTFALQPSTGHYMQLSGAYGNSIPQLGAMTAASQQIDFLHIRRGNPDIGQARLYNAMAVYGAIVRKINFQAYAILNGASRMPLADYSIENNILVESITDKAIWRQVNINLSATWTPSHVFNASIHTGYIRDRYSQNISHASWKAAAAIAYYIRNCAINVNIEIPRSYIDYSRVTTQSPWLYNLAVSWTVKAIRLECGTNNPFSSQPVYRRNLHTPVYSSSCIDSSPTDRCSAYIKAAIAFDFGTKIKHDTKNIDRNIGSGIITAH